MVDPERRRTHLRQKHLLPEWSPARSTGASSDIRGCFRSHPGWRGDEMRDDEWRFLPVDVMKKQTSHNLNTTFYFLRLSQIQDHIVPTRFTSPRPSAPTSHRTFIRTTGQGRSPLEEILDPALSCSCHTSLAPWPVPSVHLFFPSRQVLFVPVFFRTQSRQSSAVTTGH